MIVEKMTPDIWTEQNDTRHSNTEQNDTGHLDTEQNASGLLQWTQ